MLGPEPLLNVIGNICSALHAAKLLRGPYLWLKDRHGCLLSLRLRVHVHGVGSSILCNPLRKQHTQRHGAKLMGYHTSFRRKQNATHRNLATKKQNSNRNKERKGETVVMTNTICSAVSCFSGTRSCVMPVVSILFVFSRFSAVTPRQTTMRF